MTSPLTLSSIGWPAYLVSAGFGSNVSIWLQPPPMNREMTAVARGLKWDGFGAYGWTPLVGAEHASPGGAGAAASSPSRSRSHASATPLMPPPDRERNSRRSQKYRLQRCVTDHLM